MLILQGPIAAGKCREGRVGLDVNTFDLKALFLR